MMRIYCTNKQEISIRLLVSENGHDKVYKVGRKNDEIEIQLDDDSTISRQHGELKVVHPLSNLDNPWLIPVLSVEDYGSKFGTFVNDGIETNDKLGLREPERLNNGDRFRFGKLWSEFKVEYTPLVTTVENVGDMNEFRDTIWSLGGHIVTDFKTSNTKVDYMVMDSFKISPKVTVGLLLATKFVTPEYFKKLLHAYKNPDMDINVSLIIPQDFTPPIDSQIKNSSPNSLQPDSQRLDIFKGKIFIFVTSKHKKKYDFAIQSGGGTTINLNKASQRDIMNTTSILIAPSTLEINNFVQNLIDVYESTGKRMVPESEIPLTILYKSGVKYCNPYYVEVRRTAKIVKSSESPFKNVNANNEQNDSHSGYFEEPLDVPIENFNEIAIKKEGDVIKQMYLEENLFPSCDVEEDEANDQETKNVESQSQHHQEPIDPKQNNQKHSKKIKTEIIEKDKSVKESNKTISHPVDVPANVVESEPVVDFNPTFGSYGTLTSETPFAFVDQIPRTFKFEPNDDIPNPHNEQTNSIIEDEMEEVRSRQVNLPKKPQNFPKSNFQPATSKASETPTSSQKDGNAQDYSSFHFSFDSYGTNGAKNFDFPPVKIEPVDEDEFEVNSNTKSRNAEINKPPSKRTKLS